MAVVSTHVGAVKPETPHWWLQAVVFFPSHMSGDFYCKLQQKVLTLKKRYATI
jgi:hypothetical protein